MLTLNYQPVGCWKETRLSPITTVCIPRCNLENGSPVTQTADPVGQHREVDEMIRAMQHDRCKLHKGNKKHGRKQVLGCISTPGSHRKPKVAERNDVPWDFIWFYGSLILRHPFQPLGISTIQRAKHVFCWLCSASSLPQRKSDSDLGPSTGVAPWIPHGNSPMEMGTKSSNPSICEDPDPNVGPIKTNEIRYKL